MNNYSGGEAIAAGGFGCVFRPSLKCNSRNTTTTKSNSKNKTVSKLMINKYAYDEFDEFNKFKFIFEKIPKYKKYFLLPEKLCQPQQLTSDDLKNFNNKCSNLRKKNITSDNVNDNINQLKIIQLPEGGVDLSKYIENNTITKKNIYIINKQIIRLLKKAIIPMNTLGLYHFDLKAPNVMLSNKDEAKIIDFGLSTYIPEVENIPEEICYRPIQYNLPFTNVIFNTETIKEYKKFLKDFPERDHNLIYVWFKTHLDTRLTKIVGEGHLEYVSEILNDGFNKNNHSKYKYHNIVEYVTNGLKNFTDNGKFLLKSFFQTFLHNADLFGIFMVYAEFIFINNKWESEKLKINTLKEINKLYSKHIEPSSYKKIDAEVFMKDIKGMNNVLMKKKNITKTSDISKSLVSDIKTNVPTILKTISLNTGEAIRPSNQTHWTTMSNNNSRKKSTLKSSKKSTLKSTKKSTLKSSKKSTLKSTKKTSNKTRKQRRKRCPNGTRRNKKTGNCEPYIRK
jgi:hypothetical protein